MCLMGNEERLKSLLDTKYKDHEIFMFGGVVDCVKNAMLGKKSVLVLEDKVGSLEFMESVMSCYAEKIRIIKGLTFGATKASFLLVEFGNSHYGKTEIEVINEIDL